MPDRSSLRSTVSKLPPGPFLVIVAGLATYAAWIIHAAPGMPWNNVKLAPAIALWHDYNLYPPLDGSPLTDWVQGPIGALIYSLAIVGGNANGMLSLAMIIQFVMVMLPAILLMLRSAAHQPQRAAVGFSLLLGFTLATDAGMNIVLTLVLDSIAMSFLLLALLAIRPDETHPSTRREILCGLLLALAIWTKQTLLFGAAGLVIGSMLLLSVRCGLRIALAAIVGCFFLLGLFSAIFGFHDMKFWMWDVVSRHPWIEIITGQPRPFSEVLLIAMNAVAPGFVLLIGVAWLRKGQHASQPATRDLAMLCIIAIAQLPAAIIGLAKAGGWLNHPGTVAYFFAVAACCIISRPSQKTPASTHTLRADAWVALAVPLAVLILGDSLQKLRQAIHSGTRHQLTLTESLVRQYPTQIHLPWTPLASLSVERRLDHIEYGLVDLQLAGFHLTPDLYLKGLPPNLRFVAYTPSPLTRLAPDILPELQPSQPIDQLPGFTLYRFPRQ